MTWIEELEAKRAKATGGKWAHIAVKGGWDGVGTDVSVAAICSLNENNPANADYIASLHNAAPRLLALAKLADEAEHILGSVSGTTMIRALAGWRHRYAAATSPDVPR